MRSPNRVLGYLSMADESKRRKGTVKNPGRRPGLFPVNLRRVWRDLATKRDDAFFLAGRAAILLGLILLALELIRPTAVAIVHNNVGSVRLNRALLEPGLEPDERAGRAVAAGQAFGDALAWDPLNGQAYYNLATVYGVWGEMPSVNLKWKK